MGKLLERLDNELPSNIRKRSVESLDWFRSQLRDVKVTPDSLQRNTDNFVSRMELGKMYMFMYDAKHQDTLPYWDRFPLMFPIRRYGTGMLGINLHYLAPRYRVRLMDGLFEFLNSEEMNKDTRLRMTYELLMATTSLTYAKPCVKQYLYNHIDSRITEVPPQYWEIVAMLPTQQFNINANTVYAESRARF